MSILFEVTEVDFELDVEDSSFLDETWIIPVRQLLLPPPLSPLLSLYNRYMFLYDCHQSKLST